MSTANSRQQAWSRYWSVGALHSLPGSFDANYGGAIRAFWTAQLASLDTSHRVLDICTGNGPLPLLALETCAAVPFIDAVDLAEVNPPARLTALPDRIRFHPGIAAEQLPFEQGCFDLVVSHYGLEYTDHAQVFSEIDRVTARSGRLALVLHHAASKLVEVAREEQNLIEWLLRSGGFLDSAAAAYPYFALAAGQAREALRTDPDAIRARVTFNDACRALSIRATQSPVPDVLYEARGVVNTLFEHSARSGDAYDALRRHGEFCQALQEGKLRSRELCECALDRCGIDRLLGLCERAGFSPELPQPIHHENGALMGWTFVATRTA